MAGRKSKYIEHVQPHLVQITHWCRMGATEKEICGKLGVSVSVFAEYKLAYPELVDSLKRGKIIADDEVEAALFRRAVGYAFEEVKTNSYVDNSSCQKSFRTVTVKEVPADVTAAIFWLKNRRPEKWRDRRELGIEGNVPLKLIEEEQKL